ncbi:SpoIIE family protein phosphatase [Parafrankia elaeagni]|uniref:SpoIIE family protein phosphatase n=1 Tax=Parafrankia elaeagni TaxID=222534 RepID=UPI00037A2831|nr:SpoIIE family protein phosphatase [Parafrankia elaeagni]
MSGFPTDLLSAGAPVTLENCDREPIHIPGSIQPHGVLLALVEPGLTVAHVSANCGALLGVEPERVVGAPLDALVGSGPAELLRRTVASSFDLREAGPTDLVLTVRGVDVVCDAVLHRVDGMVVVELIPTVSRRPLTFADTYQRTRTAVLRLDRTTSLAELYEVAAEEVRRLTGFDRVMVYRFDPEWNGEVVAEARREDLNSFLGLHYPATDIPAQARALYERSWLRLIPDTSYRPVPLVPVVSPRTGRPLDMGDAWLRSVSPIHLEYLGNMGVTASMSVSLLRDGRLWGMLACHHYAGPHEPPYEVCAAVEFLGHVLSLRLVAREDGERLEQLVSAREALDRLTSTLEHDETGDRLAATLIDNGSVLRRLIPAGGVAVQIAGVWRWAGNVPPRNVLREMVAELDDGDGLVVEDAVALRHERFEPHRDTACGILGIRLAPDEMVVWVRPETVQTVDWGGDPHNKQLQALEGADVRLSPRRSFERWRETVRLRSRPWTEAQVGLASDLRRELTRIMYGRARQAARLTENVQQSLLPQALPDIAGFDLAALYRPAPGGRVGGDWYDAFALPGGTIVLVVGDVAGHGIAAAGTMGQLRNALRAYLVDSALDGPLTGGLAGCGSGVHVASEALRRLDRLTAVLLPEALATSVVVLLDPATATIQVASSGHPLPLHVPAGGEPRLLDVPVAPPLGAWAFATRPTPGESASAVAVDVDVTLGAGDTLILFSDGLVERRGEAPDTGLDRLQRLAACHAATSRPAALADILFEACRDPDGSDDTTVVVLRRTA